MKPKEESSLLASAAIQVRTAKLWVSSEEEDDSKRGKPADQDSRGRTRSEYPEAQGLRPRARGAEVTNRPSRIEFDKPLNESPTSREFSPWWRHRWAALEMS